MGMVTDDDVAEGVRSRWAALTGTGQVGDLIPVARVYRDVAAEKTPFPFAVLKVEETGRELFSGNTVLVDYLVTVEAYLTADAADGPTRRAIEAAFGGSAGAVTAGLTVPNAGVVHCLGRPGGATRPTAERVDGKDVKRVVAAFDLKVQGTR